MDCLVILFVLNTSLPNYIHRTKVSIVIIASIRLPVSNKENSGRSKQYLNAIMATGGCLVVLCRLAVVLIDSHRCRH